MTEIELLISRARVRDADYSPAFSDRVGELCDRLSGQLAATVRHDSTMNYRVCQMLELFVRAGAPVPDESRATELIKIAISSRVPAWATLAFRRGTRPREWTPTSSEEVWIRLDSHVRSAIVETMDGAGLQRVREAALVRLVPGEVTDLDGSPATVKDFLFCELC